MMRIVALLTSLLAAVALAQPRSSTTIEVSIVDVDVVVTDAQGKPVRGLTAGDFEVLERGKPQPITHFAAYATPSADEAQEGATLRPPRSVVVFVEKSELAPEASEELYGAIRELLRATITGPDDRVAVIGWRGTAVVRQPFTRDLNAVDALLRRMQREHAVSMRDHHGQAAAREQAEADRDAAFAGETPAPAVHELDYAMRQLARIRHKGAALQALMNGMGAIDGRKVLIMAVHRFGLFAGVEGTAGGTAPFDNRRALTNKALHDAVIRTANANDVVLYPLYPVGPRWEGVDITRGDPYSQEELAQRSAKQHNVLFNEAMALDLLAERTGGLMAWGTRNIAAMLPRVAEDLGTYYSLGYRAPSAAEDVARPIEVRTKNRRYKVRYRTELVRKSERTVMKQHVIANLYHGVGESDFPFELVLGTPRAKGRDAWSIPLRVRIPAYQLPELPETHDGPRQLSFYVAAGASVGLPGEVLHRTHFFTTDPQEEGEPRYTADFTVEVDAAADFVSVGVVDEVTLALALKRVQLPVRPAH